jgi:hypothetical protein
VFQLSFFQGCALHIMWAVVTQVHSFVTSTRSSFSNVASGILNLRRLNFTKAKVDRALKKEEENYIA